MLLHTVSVEFLNSPSNGTVQLLPSLCQEALVGNILDDRVFEDIFQLGEKTLFVDELLMLQRVKVILDFRRHIRKLGQEAQTELAANDSGRLHRALHRLFQPVDTGPEEVLDSRR